MKKFTYPNWKGFEFKPNGCLLEQVVDLSTKMGFAYERCVEFYKDFHTHDRLMLIFPRNSSSMEVRTQKPSSKLTVDSQSFLIVPKGIIHDDEGTSSIYDTFALYPDDQLLTEVFEELQLNFQQIKKLKSQCMGYQRSQWLEHLLQEYFFEKVIQKSNNKHVQFLEHAIIRESIKIHLGVSKKENQNVIDDSDTTTKALRFIESNLFSEMTNPQIAKTVGASESDFLRKFKKITKTSPYAYIKNRRLEEAKKLLMTSDHSVGDVALLVGYQNFGAFTDAFKKKYGKAPLSWRKNLTT